MSDQRTAMNLRDTVFRVLFWTMLATGSVASAAGECLSARHGAGSIPLAVPAGASWSQPVPATAFGASTLYNIDNDAFWNHDGLPALMRDAGIGALRFPGGELADNYDWASHRLARPGDFPFEAPDDAARNARTDYLEFLAAAKRVGVEQLFFVVGVDGAFREGGDLDASLLRHARHAAAWVKAVKDAGYFVPNWEIGNEPYGGGGYPLTASEYARVLNVYAREMRAADPRIRIGAAGPGGKVNYGEGVSFADLIGNEALQKLRRGKGSVIKNACPGMKTADCIEQLRHGRKPAAAPADWWAVVSSEASNSFDFAVIHRYERANLAGVGKKKRFVLSERISDLKAGLASARGKPVPVALTEWNTPNEKRRGKLDDIEHLQEIAMQTGMNAAAGLDFALYWPMRASFASHRPLFSIAAGPTPVSALLGRLARNLSGASVTQSLATTDVYALHLRDDKGDGVMLVNTGTRDISFAWHHAPATRFSVEMIAAGEARTSAPPCADSAPERAHSVVPVPARSILLARARR